MRSVMKRTSPGEAVEAATQEYRATMSAEPRRNSLPPKPRRSIMMRGSWISSDPCLLGWPPTQQPYPLDTSLSLVFGGLSAGDSAVHAGLPLDAATHTGA